MEGVNLPNTDSTRRPVRPFHSGHVGVLQCTVDAWAKSTFRISHFHRRCGAMKSDRQLKKISVLYNTQTYDGRLTMHVAACVNFLHSMHSDGETW